MTLTKVAKRLSIGIASLAFICPLALGTNQATHVNASRITANERIKRDSSILNTKVGKYYLNIYNDLTKQERSLKSHHRSTKAHVHRSHSYYKGFAYNKREYNKYESVVRHIRAHAADVKKILKYNRQSHNVKRGMNDALANTFTSSLKNNNQYKRGYVKAIIGSQRGITIQQGNEAYKVASTKSTAPAVQQARWQAHIGTL